MVKAWDSKSLDCSRSQIRIRDVVEFLLIRSLFLLFFTALYSATFCRVLASVCEAQFRFCVEIYHTIFLPFQVNINGDNFTRLDGGLASADDISWNKANSSTANQTPEKTVKIITWNQMGRCNKANLTAEQVVEVIVNRADLIRNSNFYFAFGIFSAVIISCMPFLYRYYTVPQYTLFGGMCN